MYVHAALLACPRVSSWPTWPMPFGQHSCALLLPFLMSDSSALTNSVKTVSTWSRPARSSIMSELGFVYFLARIETIKVLRVCDGKGNRSETLNFQLTARGCSHPAHASLRRHRGSSASQWRTQTAASSGAPDGASRWVLSHQGAVAALACPVAGGRTPSRSPLISRPRPSRPILGPSVSGFVVVWSVASLIRYRNW